LTGAQPQKVGFRNRKFGNSGCGDFIRLTSTCTEAVLPICLDVPAPAVIGNVAIYFWETSLNSRMRKLDLTRPRLWLY
jgi:hypothetical protein